MRKIFLSILTLLYISASTGVTLHKQYCMDMVVEGGLNHCESKLCHNCGSENINKEDNGCCRNENKYVKNDIDQNIPEQVFHLTLLTIDAFHPSFLEITFYKFASVTEVNSINHAPPPNSGVAIYLRDRVFRI